MPTLKCGVALRDAERIRSSTPTSSLHILVRSGTGLTHPLAAYIEPMLPIDADVIYIKRIGRSCLSAAHEHRAYVPQCQLVIKKSLAQRQLYEQTFEIL